MLQFLAISKLILVFLVVLIFVMCAHIFPSTVIQFYVEQKTQQPEKNRKKKIN